MVERETDFESEAVTYRMNASATMWVDKAARDSNKRSIGSISIDKVLTTDELAQGVYVVAYNTLKAMFPSVTDA